MSWLYTIVFTGLMFSSSQGSTSSNAERAIQNAPMPSEIQVQDETEKFDKTYPLNANGRVKLSNVNGSIVIEAWDRNEVKLEYTKVASSKERLADAEIRIDSRPDYLSIETDYDWKGMNNSGQYRNQGKLRIDYHLMVPRTANLNEIETVNGSVTVSNFVNFTKVSAVNGSVMASNLRGTANLSTVNGEVAADFDRLESGSKIVCSTVNGKVNLAIPSDSNATINADSLNGNISNDFGLPARKGKYIGRDLYGRLGSGDVRIKLDSVNGALSISRKNDGKALSPAVNLLPQKEKDDDSWDNDQDDEGGKQTANYVKMNKDIEKAVKEGQKEAAKAMKSAQKEMAAIQPEIAKITSASMEAAADAIAQTANVMNSPEIKEKMKIALRTQRAAMAELANLDISSSMPRVEQKSASFPVKGVPRVTIDARGCGVRVRGWDKPEVQYRVTQFSDVRNRNPVKINENHSESAVNISVENPSSDARNGDFNNDARSVRIEVFVPRKSNLKIKTNGEIRLDGVSGEIELSGSDEAINVRDVDGSLSVLSSDGRIRVIGFKGEIVAESSDGMISLEGDFRKLKAQSGDGEIIVTLPEDAQADIEANCEDIRGEEIAMARIGGDENFSRYRIGKGGSLFQIHTGGEIRVRGASTLKTGF
ncbi:MAG: DUF4097 family beta strand repeat-containing protein [Pyrinomonadaceae bacterium]